MALMTSKGFNAALDAAQKTPTVAKPRDLLTKTADTAPAQDVRNPMASRFGLNIPQPAQQTGTLQPMPVPSAAPPDGLTATGTATQPLGPVPAAPQGQPTTQGGVGLTPTDPNNPLTQQTIGRNPLVDRFNLAQDRFNTFTQATDPQYRAALRDAQRAAAATGGIGSGMLRTSLGDLGSQRTLQLQTAQNELLQNALEGTIGDTFRDIGVAQQQQGFQSQQQQQAFENELRRLGFTEDMLNSAFGRALQTYMAGQTGGTGSGTGVAVGQNIFGQGQSALDALNALLGQRASNAAAGQTPPFNPSAGTPMQGTQVPWLGGTGA